MPRLEFKENTLILYLPALSCNGSNLGPVQMQINFILAKSNSDQFQLNHMVTG